MNFSGLVPLILLLLLGLLIFAFTKFARRGSYGAIEGNSVRRFFQYILLFGLLVVSALGLTGLLERLIRGATLITANQTELARNVSFVIVGVPLFVLVALWTRRKFLEESSEAKSFGWGLYFTFSSITSLIVTVLALHEVLTFLLGNEKYSGDSVARLIVWGAIWAAHWTIDLRVTPVANSRLHHLAGSFVGLITVVIGLSELLASVIARILHLGGDALVTRGGNPILLSAVTFVVGVPVWYLYWLRTYARTERDSVWLAYVLLVGVGGGLILAVASAATVLYQLLVWFVGSPSSAQASSHFQNFPSYSGTALVGIFVWWYHHALLEEARQAIRTEVQRIYEYLIAGIGLGATAGGLSVVLTALIGSLTRTPAMVGGTGSTNTLIAAGTLLVVGAPIWWIFWQRIQGVVGKFPQAEHTSVTRRIYLFLLFGVGGLTGAVALLVGVFFLFDDIFKANFGANTIYRARFGISILLTAFAVAGYHWMIYRNEREFVPAGQKRLRFVLLLGAKNVALVRAISEHTGARVEVWQKVDDDSGFGPIENVLKVLDGVKEESVVLLAEASGVTVIPIDRD